MSAASSAEAATSRLIAATVAAPWLFGILGLILTEGQTYQVSKTVLIAYTVVLAVLAGYVLLLNQLSPTRSSDHS